MTENGPETPPVSSEITIPTSPDTMPKCSGSAQTQNTVATASTLPVKSRLRAKWPFDAAVTIALLALLVSLGQLLFTAPMLVDLYLHPDVVVIDEHQVSADISIFRLENRGRASAQEVELGILSFENDQLEVMPELGASLTYNKSVLYRTFRIVLPFLTPGEGVNVLVRLKDENHRKDIRGYIERTDGKRIWTRTIVPGISYLRSRSGPGRILATRSDNVLTDAPSTPE